MAFVIEQPLEGAQHEYDRDGDVLYISFGPPRPCVTLAVEDWLAIQVTPSAGQLCGITIIGFKRIFSQIRPDLIENLPERVDRLKKARFCVQYMDETDAWTVRFEEEQPAYYERFGDNVYLERSLIGGDIVGFKITRWTEHGQRAMENLLSSMIEALFATPGTAPSPADALTRAFLEHLDIPESLALSA